MQLPNNSKPLIADESIEHYDFTIEHEDAGHIIAMLSDKLYSDKVLAVVREYMANAFDACIEAGNRTPIVVTVPNSLSPIFKVRDYGLGLSKDDVLNVFIKMGRSTKRESDKQVGAFGIGGKSFRAYGDSLNIVSIHNGIRTVYTAQKQQNGGNRLFVVHEEKTAEASGVEISISVNPKDLGEFENKILYLSRFFEIPPVLKGTTRTFEPLREGISSRNWFVHKDTHYGVQGRSFAIMGNIPYPIEDQHLSGENQNVFRNNGICVEVKIGDVDISPDREKLEYTNKTKGLLNRVAAQIKKEFAQKVLDSIAAQPTYFDAVKLWADTMMPDFCKKNDLEPVWKDRKVVVNRKIPKQSWTYNETTCKEDLVPPPFGSLKLLRFCSHRKTVKLASFDKWTFGPTDTIAFAEPHVKSVQQRAYTLYRGACDLSVISGTKEEIEAFGAAINMDLLPNVVNLSTVEKTPLNPRMSGNGAESRAHIKFFENEDDGSPSGWKSAEPDDDGEEEMVYVPLLRFHWAKNGGKHPKADLLGQMMNALLAIGIDKPIYGVREKDVEDLGDNWTEFGEFFEREAAAWKATADLDGIEYLNFSIDSGLERKAREIVRKVDLAEDSPLLGLVNALGQRDFAHRKFRAISQHSFVLDLPKTSEDADLTAKINEDYPLLHHFSSWGSLGDSVKYAALQEFARKNNFKLADNLKA